MKNFLKSHWKTLVFFTLAGIIGGFCCGLYLLDSYPPDIVQQITDQGFTPFLAGLVSAYQAAGYGLVLGALGIVLAKKTGLWKDERKIEKKPLLAAVIIAPEVKMSLDTRNKMPTRIANTAPIASAIHLRNCEDIGRDSPLFFVDILENATMLQPSISVVRTVAIA